MQQLNFPRIVGGNPVDWTGFVSQLEQQNMEGAAPAVLSALQASEFIEKSRRALTNMVVSLNALSVHEHLRPAVDALKTEMNGLIGKLPPLEAHKAATDSNYALSSFGYAMDSCQNALEHATQTVARLSKDCTAQMNAKEASMNGLVETAVTAEITKQVGEGKLFKKETVDGLVEAARNKAREIALNGIQTIATRKGQLTTLKLPVPDNESILEGDDAAFKTLTDTAAARIVTLKAKGLSLNNAPELIKSLIYSQAFDQDLKIVLGTLAASGSAPGGDPAPGDKKKVRVL